MQPNFTHEYLSCTTEKNIPRMKNFVQTTAIFIIIIVFFGSCGKEHKIRKDLSGTWKVTSTTDDSINSAMSIGVNFQYQFSDCKKQDEPCSGVYTFTYDFLGLPISVSANYKWNVKKDVLTITPEDTANLNPGSFNILFNSDTKVTATDVSNASTFYILEKL